MRILHISTRLIVGGSQENTILSCRGQLDLRHEVHLAFGPIYGPEGSMLAEATERRSDGATKGRGIVTHEVPDLVRDLAPIRDVRALRQLRRLVREVDPDVVHTHSSKAGILGRMAAWNEGGRLGRRVVVHTVHGPPFHRYLPAWRNLLYVRAERFAARRCHRIVSVAEAMTRQYRAQGIGRPEQFVTVYSGMETAPYLHAPTDGPDARDAVRAEMGFDPGDIVIGTVSRLAELKGHDDLLDALADDLRGHRSWKLLWVGDGWKRKALEARLTAAGIRDQVVLTGLVAPGRVPRYVRAMDLVVHPSYREGLPRVVPQALLAGIPVVAYDVDGTGEACIEKETGRLVGTGDLSGLRIAIEWSIEHREEARALARAGRERCVDRFDWRTMVRALEEVYGQAMASARSRG